jgi:hypothetical protein
MDVATLALGPATLALAPATLAPATLAPATLALMQLFHTLPYEIKEIIQRFTYKCQSKSLLSEIKAFHAAKQYLQEFTILIDNYYSDHATTDSVKERLWTGLNYIREKPYKTKLIQNWKYKSEFNSADKEHADGEKNFRLMDWTTSFTIYFWMCIHH